ncbi:CHAD domain-containing protein [Methanolobus sp. ZRKC2]|uniref:CHAD domain-containing protein n=1 Tax=Methanolobus sp. ZRKC2 TaxID=3125783 RepID=UPI0032533E96
MQGKALFKKYSVLAAFSFLFGLVFSMTGVLYAIVGKVSRYSDPQVILISCTLIGLGFVLTLIGINFGGMKQKITRSISFLAGVFLSFGGLVLFLTSYPENWFYPTVAYALISYSLGVFLLLINIFVNYYTGLFLQSEQPSNEMPADHDNVEKASEKSFGKDNSIMATFAGILLTNLLSDGPDSSLYRKDERNDESLVTVQVNEDNIIEAEHEDLNAEDVPNRSVEDSGDSMEVEIEAASNDSSGKVGEVEETAVEEVNVNAKPVSREERTEVVMPYSDFLSMKKTNVKAADSMRVAARKILMFHFGVMIEHERGTKVGKDIEELHDMRVAAMRMRSVVEVLEDYLDMKEMSSYYKNIKSTRKVLGTVRDLDVFLEKIDHYLEGQPPERRLEMDPLTDSILIERAKNRGNMLVYLDDSKYNKFKKNFSSYLLHKKSWKMKSVKKDGEPIPSRVRDILPVLLYTQFATVRAYDEIVSDESIVDPSLEKYHQLRIDVKILRYTLEFFKEVLGSESKGLIKDLKVLQDNLGDMHDTVVALELLENFEKYGTWGEVSKKKSSGSGGLQDYPGVDAYMEYRKQELQNLLEAFPNAWSKVIDHDFSVRFSQAISGIYTS